MPTKITFEKLKIYLKSFEALDWLSVTKINNSIWATNGHFIIKFSEGEELQLNNKQFFYETTCTDCDRRNKSCKKLKVRKTCALNKEEEFFRPRGNRLDSNPIIKKAKLATLDLKFVFQDTSTKVNADIFYCSTVKQHVPFSSNYLNIFKEFYGDILISYTGDIERPSYIKDKNSLLIGVLMPMFLDKEELAKKVEKCSKK